MPLILPGNVASATAATTYTVANSCRFDAATSAKMHKAVSTSNSNTKFTISFWMKPSKYNAYQRILWGGVGSGNESGITLYAQGRDDVADGVLSIYFNGSSSVRSWLTERAFRDYASWYHIFIRVDTTDSTAADRIQLWVNGVRETDFSESSNPGEDETFDLFHTNNITVGMEQDSGDQFPYNGYLAEFVVLDGTAAAVTDLGEFDEDSPNIWKPIDPSGLSFGTSGFWLDFEDSANLGNDANGGTDLTETNIAAVDQCTDSPTNNFCTANPLNGPFVGTLSEGNCKYIPTATAHTVEGTMGITAGKWYWEVRCSDDSIAFGLLENGWSPVGNSDDNYPAYTIVNTGNTTWVAYNNVSAGNQGSNFTDTAVPDTGDAIVQIAFDADNQNMYVGLDNDWMNSGDPTSGASGTGAVVTSIQAENGGTIIPFFGVSGGVSRTWELNFGNPTWTLSSAANDANGYGNFEFAPPSGYYALCTKNLAEFGG